jgi:hypothetical protein
MRSRPHRLLATVVVVAALATVRDAGATACPAADAEAKVGDIDSEVRLAYLAKAFDREVSAVDTWSWTWGSVYTAGATAEGVGLAESHDHGTRIDLTVGVVATTFGAVSLYGLPLKLTLPLRAARRRWDDADRCEVVARAERTLVSVESNQALANGPLAHIGNVAVNAGLFLLLGLGYGRWPSAALSGGVGVAVGETNAFTQPHHLREVLARYRSGQLEDASPAAVTWSIVPVVEPHLQGARFAVAW